MEELTFARFNEETCRMHKEEDGLYHRLAKRFGLSDSALWILYALEAFRAPVTQAELCGYLSLSKQTINSGLKQLQLEDCIRLVSGPGRRKYLCLTARGERLTAGTAPQARSSVRPRRRGPACWPWNTNTCPCCSGNRSKFSTHPRRNKRYGDQAL